MMKENIMQLRATYRKSILFAFLTVIVLSCALVIGLLQINAQPFALAFLSVSAALFLFSIISSNFYFRLLDKSPMAITRYYLIYMSMRFVFGGLLLVVGNLLGGANSKAVLLSFCAVFMMSLVTESCLFVQIEKKLKKDLSNE